jgi:prolyl 4-hydroxylase
MALKLLRLFELQGRLGLLIIDQKLTCDLCGTEMGVLRQTMQPGVAMQHITRGPIGVTQWQDVCAECSVPLRQAITDLTKKKQSDPAALARIGATVRASLEANPRVERLDANGAELYKVYNFMTPLECEMVIKRIDAIAVPSPLYEEGNAPKDHRTSFSAHFPVEDEFMNMLQRRTDDLLGIGKAYGERLQGARYKVGQQFKSHMDWFWPNTGYYQMEMDRAGQRSWTAMTYLNDVEEGGETVFKELGLSFKPELGMLVIWNNATPEGEPNKMVLHSGEPVIEGIKYITTKWYREREWN